MDIKLLMGNLLVQDMTLYNIFYFNTGNVIQQWVKKKNG